MTYNQKTGDYYHHQHLKENFQPKLPIIITINIERKYINYEYYSIIYKYIYN